MWWRKRNNKKRDWELEVDQILKEASFDSRLKTFMEEFQKQEPDNPPEEWQEVLNAFFNDLISEAPALACCIFAFKAGQVWERYQTEIQEGG